MIRCCKCLLHLFKLRYRICAHNWLVNATAHHWQLAMITYEITTQMVQGFGNDWIHDKYLELETYHACVFEIKLVQ